MFTFEPIAYVRSPYREKFAIPRQPGLVPSARGRVVLTGPSNCEAAIDGLQHYSHLWLQFVFHATAEQGWKPKVRPPRLGGNARVGVFATRSTFRPNPIGLSAVKLDSLCFEDGHWQLCISGFDLLDGTPVLDIKPYIGYSDALRDSTDSFAQQPPVTMPVEFSPRASHILQDQPELTQLIREVLAQDPRPAYKRGKPDDKIYAVHLQNSNVQWQVIGERAVVTTVSDC
ncbi:tRNA (N6-threonylcarbamoyladenosine(37)-N6)-methyltransferase TrmO [Aliidiomarina sp. Khilg15.8]